MGQVGIPRRSSTTTAPRPVTLDTGPKTRPRRTPVLFNKAIAKVFGTSNERAVKRLMPIVKQISDLEPATQALSDEALRAKTAEFRQRIAAAIEGIEDADERIAAEKAALNDILPEAFAVVREAGKRAVQMRHFDVQLIGGIVL